MWTCVDSVWEAADSRNDLRARVERLDRDVVLPMVEAEEATAYGLLTVPDNSPLHIPVCYSHVGIQPSVAVSNDLLALGLGGEVVAVRRQSGEQIFRYRMPTTFHEFLPWKGQELLCKDEIGFVLLSTDGEETWSFLLDVVGDFEVDGNTIRGETMEGQPFQTKLPEGV